MTIKQFKKLTRESFERIIKDTNISPSDYHKFALMTLNKARTSRERFEVRKLASEILGVDRPLVSPKEKLYGSLTPMVKNKDGSFTPVDELNREITKDDEIVIKRGSWDR